MEFSAIFKITVFITMSLVVNGMTGPNFEIENIPQMGTDAVSMAFSNEMTEFGEVNGTKEANVTTMDHGLETDETKEGKQANDNVTTTDHGLEKSTISPREDNGRWMVIDCDHSNDTHIYQWTCDLRRRFWFAFFGLIDTLKVTVAKNSSLELWNMAQPCRTCKDEGQNLHLRLVVECPRQLDIECSEGMMCVHEKVYYLLLIFFATFTSIFAAFLCGVCTLKCAGYGKRSNRVGKSFVLRMVPLQ